ncbi:hypothetical protein [Breoghania sp.]|uniref:hypothetical protein n=1 Tax=Breoghania sp. TaxID=2065378 RepID=UPI0026050FDD|nr:hypothetical protein [Breoghania sp.]MDJ0931695.1 hypothetical protein [Breoghania sp.]
MAAQDDTSIDLASADDMSIPTAKPVEEDTVEPLAFNDPKKDEKPSDIFTKLIRGGQADRGGR